MRRSDHREVTAVECGHGLEPESFRNGDHRGVGRTERQVGVLLDEVGHAEQVGRQGRLDPVPSISERPEHHRLGPRAERTFDEVRRLSKHKSGYQERRLGSPQKIR